MTFASPTRALTAVRPTASLGVLAAAASVAVVFAATPFAIAETVTELEVSVGSSAQLSTVQVSAFTLATAFAGRRLRPSVTLLRWALLLTAVAGVASAVAADLATLLVTRGLTGLGMGTITWLAWADAAGDGRRQGEVAAVGPLVTAVASPLLAIAADRGGLAALYLLTAAATIAPLLAPMAISAGATRVRRRTTIRRSSRFLLVALLALTAGGSSVFVFATVIAVDEASMTPFQVSLALALNAMLSIPAARYGARRRVPGLWMAVTGFCAAGLAVASSPAMVFLALGLWGVSFWVAVPELFGLLSDRSQHPADRVGDAQAAMSAGRILGPSLGGALVSAGSLTTLGIIAGALMVAAGVTTELVATHHRWRRT